MEYFKLEDLPTARINLMCYSFFGSLEKNSAFMLTLMKWITRDEADLRNLRFKTRLAF